MSEKEKNPLLARQIIDRAKINITKVAGVNKATVPKKFKTMHCLQGLFASDVEMLVVMEDGVPFLEIRRVKKA